MRDLRTGNKIPLRRLEGREPDSFKVNQKWLTCITMLGFPIAEPTFLPRKDEQRAVRKE